jgi:hypothetical protein
MNEGKVAWKSRAAGCELILEFAKQDWAARKGRELTSRKLSLPSNASKGNFLDAISYPIGSR